MEKQSKTLLKSVMSELETMKNNLGLFYSQLEGVVEPEKISPSSSSHLSTTISTSQAIVEVTLPPPTESPLETLPSSETTDGSILEEDERDPVSELNASKKKSLSEFGVERGNGETGSRHSSRKGIGGSGSTASVKISQSVSVKSGLGTGGTTENVMNENVLGEEGESSSRRGSLDMVKGRRPTRRESLSLTRSALAGINAESMRSVRRKSTLSMEAPDLKDFNFSKEKGTSDFTNLLAQSSFQSRGSDDLPPLARLKDGERKRNSLGEVLPPPLKKIGRQTSLLSELRINADDGAYSRTMNARNLPPKPLENKRGSHSSSTELDHLVMSIPSHAINSILKEHEIMDLQSSKIMPDAPPLSRRMSRVASMFTDDSKRRLSSASITSPRNVPTPVPTKMRDEEEKEKTDSDKEEGEERKEHRGPQKQFKEISTLDSKAKLNFRIKDALAALGMKLLDYATMDASPNKIAATMSDLFPTEMASHKLVHPRSRLRIHWNLVFFLWVTLLSFVYPVMSAYLIGGSELQGVLGCVTLILFLDMVLSALTDIQGEKLNVDHTIKAVLLDYCKSIFPCDLFIFAIFAYGCVDNINDGGMNPIIVLLTDLALLVKMVQIRLSRRHRRKVQFIKTISHLTELSSTIMNSVNLFLRVLLYCHWDACLQFVVIRILDYPSNSWFVTLNLYEQSAFNQYTQSLFAIISMIVTCGYGNMTGTNLSEIWFMICSMSFGCIFYAVILGDVFGMLDSLDTSGKCFKEKMDQVMAYMKSINIDSQTRQKIIDYYTFKYPSGRYYDEEEIITELNSSLRMAISKRSTEQLILKVPFFRSCPQQMKNQLVSCLTLLYILPNQIFIEQGSFGEEMYFVQTGVLEVLSGGMLVKTLSQGMFFGEMGVLLGKIKRGVSIKAVSYSTLYRLRKVDLDPILEHYPEVKEKLKAFTEQKTQEFKI